MQAIHNAVGDFLGVAVTLAEHTSFVRSRWSFVSPQPSLEWVAEADRMRDLMRKWIMDCLHVPAHLLNGAVTGSVASITGHEAGATTVNGHRNADALALAFGSSRGGDGRGE